MRLVPALLALLLGAAPGPPGDARTLCAREGDWLVCDTGQRYAIRQDPYAPTRPGRWRPDRRPRADEDRSWPGDDRGRAVPIPGIPGFPGALDGAPLGTPDGLECWPHGDHVHCR